jgi:DNA-binding transcriptional LysR family regulator
MRIPRVTSQMLLAVIATAEKRSIKRAGQELHIGQSAVYKQVKAASDLFRKRLFVKTDTGMALTETGEVFYSEAELSKLADLSAQLDLILLDKRVLGPGRAKPGWGVGSGRLRRVLSRCLR